MTLVVDLAYNNMTTQNINGKDVTLPMDWSTISPLPDAVLTKATEWLNTDASFSANWHALGALNIPRAAYHYYHNGNIFYTSARQAKNFVNVILANGFKASDFFVCDNEEKDSHGTPLVSMSETLDWFYNVQVGLGLTDYSRFLLYSTADILNNLNLSKLNAAQLAILKQIRIWVAGYPNTAPSGADGQPSGDLVSVPKAYQVSAPYGATILWQYAESVPNVSNIPGGVDLNQIDAAFLKEWQAGAAPISAPITPIPAPVTPNVLFPMKVVTIITQNPDGTFNFSSTRG